MIRLLFFITFMGVSTGLLIWMLSTDPAQQNTVPEPPPEQVNIMEMTRVAIRQMEGNQLRWELWANSASLLNDANTANLRGVRFNIHGEKAQGAIFKGRSRSARLTGKPLGVSLEGEVVLEKGSEVEIRTERVVYDQVRNLMRAPGKVWLKTPGTVHGGDSLTYSINEEKIVLTNPFLMQ